MDQLSTSTGKLIALGDFNIHMNTKCQEAVRFKALLFSINMEQHVKNATHISGHLLDLVISRCDELLPCKLEVGAPVISDHSPITFHISMPKPPPVKKTISYRKV